mmetsp:Transcript_38674/g.106798  ORF Transcript_38674/g.106798 Transcript_38674/m.106798 type:complete len:370 (+) Transcript_38674:154-1263(+)
MGTATPPLRHDLEPAQLEPSALRPSHAGAPAHVERLERGRVLRHRRERSVGEPPAIAQVEAAQAGARARERADGRIGEPRAVRHVDGLEKRRAVRDCNEPAFGEAHAARQLQCAQAGQRRRLRRRIELQAISGWPAGAIIMLARGAGGAITQRTLARRAAGRLARRPVSAPRGLGAGVDVWVLERQRARMRDRQLLESIAAVKGGRLERGAAADRELAQRRAARDVEDAEARQAVDGDGSEAVTAGEAQREEGRQLAEPAEARAAEEGGECAVREAFASAEVEVRQLRERRGYGERVERGAVDEREAHQGTERGHAHLLQPCRTADRDLGQRGAPRELQRAREGFRREGFRRRWEGCRHVPARRRGCEG